MRHARSATIDEVENNFITKQVMNTAQGHWNEEAMRGSPLGDGRLVFGLITGSLTVGLTSQDTAENAIAELGLDKVRFTKPVHHGDTITAFTEVLAADPTRPIATTPASCASSTGAATSTAQIVCELERTVLVKAKPWDAVMRPHHRPRATPRRCARSARGR